MNVIGFQLPTIKCEWKPALKRTRYYVSPENQANARYK